MTEIYRYRNLGHPLAASDVHSHATTAHLWPLTVLDMSGTSAHTRARSLLHVQCVVAALATSLTWRRTCAGTRARSRSRVMCAAVSLASRWHSSSTCRKSILLSHSGASSAQLSLPARVDWTLTPGVTHPGSCAPCACGHSSTSVISHATWSSTPMRLLDGLLTLPGIVAQQTQKQHSE